MGTTSADRCIRPTYTDFSKLNPIRSSPDLTGIGVTIGFMATTYIVVLILVVYYVVAFQPELDPFAEDRLPESDEEYEPNPVDRAFLARVRQGFGEKAAFWFNTRDTFDRCVLKMSDLQIVTGLAVLISGYATLKSSNLTVYDWKILTYVAWFSVTTHLATLTFLRHYLHRQKGKLVWRLLCMSLTAIMLVTATVVAGRDERLMRLPAGCLFRLSWTEEDMGNPLFNVVISLTLLAFTFVTRIVKLKMGLSVKHFARWRATANRAYQTLLDKTYNARWHWTYRSLLVYLLLMRLLLDILSSVLLEIYSLVFMTLWGTSNLLQARFIRDTTDDEWTVGQVLPVVLLLAPLTTVFESFFDRDTQTPTPSLMFRRRTPTPLYSGRVHSPERDYYQVKWFQLLHHQSWVAIINYTLVILVIKMNSKGWPLTISEAIFGGLMQVAAIIVLFPIYSLAAMALEDHFLTHRKSPLWESTTYQCLALSTCVIQLVFAIVLQLTRGFDVAFFPWMFGFIYICCLLRSILFNFATLCTPAPRQRGTV